jgi:hypothetical protein
MPLTAEKLANAHARLDPIAVKGRIPGTMAGVFAAAKALGLDPDELTDAMMSRSRQVLGPAVQADEVGTYGAAYVDGILAAVAALRGE